MGTDAVRAEWQHSPHRFFRRVPKRSAWAFRSTTPWANGPLGQLKVLPMKIYLKKSAWGQLTLIFTLACFAFSPTALAVTPADGDYRNQNTAKDALFRFTAGIDNTALGLMRWTTLWRVGSGLAQAVSTSHVMCTRRPC